MPSVSFSRFLFFSFISYKLSFIFSQTFIIHNLCYLYFLTCRTHKHTSCVIVTAMHCNGSFTSCCTVHGKECLHAHKDTSILVPSKFCLNKKVLLVIYNNIITFGVVVGIMGWIVLRHIIITIFSYSFTFLTQCININTSLIIIVV